MGDSARPKKVAQGNQRQVLVAPLMRMLAPALLGFVVLGLVGCGSGSNSTDSSSSNYSVTASGTNVTLSPGTTQSVASGANVSFNVTPASGDTLSSTVGGTCPSGSWSGSVYTTGAITANCTVVFSASSIVYSVTPSGTSVTISPNKAQTVGSGGAASFTVTPASGYSLVPTVTGTCPYGSWDGAVYSTGAITANCTAAFLAVTHPFGPFIFEFSSTPPDMPIFDNWLAGPLTGVSYATPPNNTYASQVHAKGLGVLAYLAGNCVPSYIASCEASLQQYAQQGVDAVVLDEPAFNASWVSGWQTLINYWHSVNPNGQFGMSLNDSTVALSYLQAGLTSIDFVDTEVYSQTYPWTTPFTGANDLKALYGIKTMLLAYNTSAICSSGSFSTFDSIAFWDLDNYGVWANQSLMDADWLKHAETMASTGSAASVCVLPYSFNDTNYPVNGVQTANFSLTAWDGFIGSWSTPYTISACQYEVIAGANIDFGGPSASGVVVTVPWTSRPCNGQTPTITIGPTGNCNVSSNGLPLTVSGSPALTCAVLLRAQTNTGVWGTAGYSEFAVKF